MKTHKIKDYTIFQEDIYCECTCECFVRVQVNEWDWSKEGDGSELERGLIISYLNPNGSWELHKFHHWGTRIKRAWLALRNKDWMPGFEFYNKEATKDFALAVQKATMVVQYGRDFPVDKLNSM